MFNFIFLGIVAALIIGVAINVSLDIQKKWTDSTHFIVGGVVFGICLIMIRIMNPILYVNVWFIVSLVALAYSTTYYLLYKDFMAKYKDLKLGFWQYMSLSARNSKITIVENPTEDTIRNMTRDLLFSQEMKEVTKIWYEDRPEQGAGWGWFAIIWNFALFVLITLGVFSEGSIENVFYALIWDNSELKSFVVATIFLILLGVIFSIMKKKIS